MYTEMLCRCLYRCILLEQRGLTGNSSCTLSAAEVNFYICTTSLQPIFAQNSSFLVMIYCPDIEVSSEDYIVTSTGNIISRKASICKPQAVEIPLGRCIICPDVIVRGDLAAVQLNRYCLIGARTVLHPCYTTTTSSAGVKSLKFVPQTIGADSWIGEDCVIEAAVIGTGCVIGNNCVLSKRCILKDFVYVEEGSVVPPDMVVPPFCIVAGNPAKIIGEMPESTSTLGHRAAVERYKAYVVKPK